MYACFRFAFILILLKLFNILNSQTSIIIKYILNNLNRKSPCSLSQLEINHKGYYGKMTWIKVQLSGQICTHMKRTLSNRKITFLMPN